jgi:hypothetical protein
MYVPDYEVEGKSLCAVLPGKYFNNTNASSMKYTAFSTPHQAVGSCYDDGRLTVPPTPAPSPETSCGLYLARACKSRLKSLKYCEECAAIAVQNGTCSKNESNAWCWEHASKAPCDYQQMAGQMWKQRLNQYLVANGIAVMEVNPYLTDQMDSDPKSWAGFQYNISGAQHTWGGADKPWYQELFSRMVKGAFGPINTKRVMFRGWSAGAQFVSWMFQVRWQ